MVHKKKTGYYASMLIGIEQDALFLKLEVRTQGDVLISQLAVVIDVNGERRGAAEARWSIRWPLERVGSCWELKQTPDTV